MKQRVTYKAVEYLYVKANSVEEAKEIAEEVDGGEFTQHQLCGGWEFEDVVDENGNVEKQEV